MGLGVNISYTDWYRVPPLIDLQLSGFVQQDLWIVDGASLPPLAYRQALLSVDDYISQDPAARWSDVHPLWSSLSRFGNKTVAVPLDSDVLLLYYRRDVFEALNLSVPATWDELEQTAASWNAQHIGSGDFPPPPPPSAPPADNTSVRQAPPQPRYGLCLNDASYCTTSAMLSAILASITQRYGPRTGWALALDQKDASQATQIVNGTAMAAALETYKALAAQSPSRLACQQTLSMFASGQCLMTINWGRQFKALQQGSPVRGFVGIELTPGSSRVLDRTHGTLVPAGPLACRNASRAPSGGWSCRAPMLAYGGTFGVIGLRNDASYQQHAFQFLALLLSTPTSWDGVLDPSSPVEPVRTSMMQPEAEQMLQGLGSLIGFSGFDPSDAHAYLAALRKAFAHNNTAMEFGAPGSFSLRYAMEEAIMAYLAGAPAEAVADKMLLNWLSLWSAAGYTVAEVQSMLLLATPDPFGPSDVQQRGTKLHQVLGWPIAAGALGAVMLLSALFSIMCWMTSRSARRAVLRRIVAPLSGAETTLVVTDIQDSTKLWEAASSDVMDIAIYHHHSLARKLMLRFRGYESATEGDSFIIAFHAADDAVCFCASFQQELLLVAWPEELLSLDSCRAVYMCKSEPLPKKRGKSQQNAHLEVARTQGPLISSGQPSVLFQSPYSITPGLSQQGNSLILGVNSSAQNAVTSRAGTLSITYGAPSSVLAAAPESPIRGPTPSMPSASGPTLPPRHLRTTGSFAGPSSGPGSMTNMGALGASPRQLSLLGRSVSRLGVQQHSVASAAGATLQPARSLERNPGRSPTISISGGLSISGNAQANLPAALCPAPGEAPAPVGAAAGAADAAAASGGTSTAAARAAFAAGGVMSFRESFREDRTGGEIAPRLASETGSASSARHTTDGTSARVPTLTGYQPVAPIGPSPSADGASPAPGVDGGSGAGRASPREHVPALARRSLPRSVSEAARHGRARSGMGALGGHEAMATFCLPDTLEGGGGSDGADRPTANSRMSRSTATDMASVSEFNTVLESGGQHYVRCSETGAGPLSPTEAFRGARGVFSRPALPTLGPAVTASQAAAANGNDSSDTEPELVVTHQLLGKMLSSGISSAAPEHTAGTGVVSAAQTSAAGSEPVSGGGASSAAPGSGGGASTAPGPGEPLGPLAEGVPAELPGLPPRSPRAAARRSSVTFDFRPGANTSSGDEQYGCVPAAGGAAMPPGASMAAGVVCLRYNSQSQSSPQLVLTNGVVQGSTEDPALGNTQSQASYTASQASSRPSPVAYGRPPSHLRSGGAGLSGGPAFPGPLGLAARASSLRRRSDTTTLASGFSDLHAYHSAYGQDSALRPSPLGRGFSHKAVPISYRARGHASSGGNTSDGGGNSSTGRGVHNGSAHGEEVELPDPDPRGQSSPLPLIFAPDPLLSEDGTGAGLAVGSISGVRAGEDGLAHPTSPADAAEPDPRPSRPLQRNASLVFPLVKRSHTDHFRAVPTPYASNGGAGGVGGTGHAPLGVSMRAVASTNSTAGRGLFGLVPLPSPRPAGAGGGLLSLGTGAAFVPDSRAASMVSMMRLASQHNLQSVGDTLCSRWRVVDERDAGAQLVFRGLRVRVGVHSGLSGITDAVHLNRTANRMQYTGLGLQMAKAVCDCAHGGQVLMSEAAFTQLAVESLKQRVMVLHMGEHRMKDELPTSSIYLACPRALQGRLPALRSIRSIQQHSLGVLEAPAGQVVVVFMHVVGAMSLLDWRPDLAHTALSMFRDHVTLELIKYQGYLVEAVDGLVLASFSSPSAGLRWAAKCQHDMTMLPWPQELLSHEACEELCISRPNPSSGQQEEVVLFRGLRLKAGVDVGRLRGEINCITGRMSYRGRAMNRAARIVAAAGSGQVLASSDVWTASNTQAAAHVCGLTAVSMGQFSLKGVSEALELYRIKTTTEVISKRTKAILNSQEDPLELDELPIADPAAALQHHTAINNASSAAAAAAATALAHNTASPHALRSASTSAAVGVGGGAAGVPARLMLERVHSMSGGLTAALRREESMSRGAKGSLSRQVSRNVSVRSRRSSRRSSVGSQFSTLAANTMVAVARGSLDGRQDAASPVRPAGGAPQQAQPLAAGGALQSSVSGPLSTQASVSLSIQAHANAGAAPIVPASLLTGGGSTVNTLHSVGSHGFHLPYGATSIGSGTRTSRNSVGGELPDTDGTRSSAQRSSNASVRNSGAALLSRASHTAAAHGPQLPAAASPVPLRPGPAPGLVRHLSTLIRSASQAIYGSSAPQGASPGAQLQHPSVAIALSPTPESDFDLGTSMARGSVERRVRHSVRRDSTFTATSAAAMGLPVSGSPTNGGQGQAGVGGGSAGSALRDMLPPRLRGAGAVFRVGSFSGHIRRRAEDSTSASEFGKSPSNRGGRSPPGGRRQASTMTGIGYVAAITAASASTGGLVSPSSATRRGLGAFRRRSSGDPLRPQSAAAERGGRRSRPEGLVGLAEAPEVAEDSFVIVVGDADHEGGSEESEGHQAADSDAAPALTAAAVSPAAAALQAAGLDDAQFSQPASGRVRLG